jgi:hypothetical protein
MFSRIQTRIRSTANPGRHGVLSMTVLTLVAALLNGCAAGRHNAAEVRVTDTTLFGDMDCFRIETPTATYLLGKRGGGLASLIDPQGRDWISYRHGGKAAGEYRGLPKAGQPVKYFHCGYGYGQYTNSNWFRTRVVLTSAGHVRIATETRDSRSAGMWDFFADRATFTLERIASTNFWFLYEGTPGGRLDSAHDVVLRPDGQRTSLAEPWEAPAPWAWFVSEASSWALLCRSDSPAVEDATYVAWPYRPEPDGALHQMTVFGWGRLGWKDPRQHQPQLWQTPARFTIALARKDDDLLQLATSLGRAPAAHR